VRLETLAALNAAEIPTYVFVGPLFPHYRYRRDLLEDLFKSIRDAGTTSIFAEHLNTSAYILRRINPLVEKAEQSVKDVYASARTQEHRHALSEMVLGLVEKYGFDLRLKR
jgi:DNA repair photolyase